MTALLVPLLGHTPLARELLVPTVAQSLDAKALVVGVVAGKVTIRLESERRVTACKDEFLVVTHVESLQRGLWQAYSAGGPRCEHNLGDKLREPRFERLGAVSRAQQVTGVGSLQFC